MKGTVKWFQVCEGTGRIQGDDEVEYFIHQSDIFGRTGTNLRFLVEGERVNFTTTETDGKQKAIELTLDTPASSVELSTHPALALVEGGMTMVRVDSKGRLYGLKETTAARPHVALDGKFRAYSMGTAHARGVSLKLPQADAAAGMILMDIQKAARRAPANDRWYENVAPGSYFLATKRDGTVSLWRLGRRIQDLPDAREGKQKGAETESWIVIEMVWKGRIDTSHATLGQIEAQASFLRDKTNLARAIDRAIVDMGQRSSVSADTEPDPGTKKPAYLRF